MQAWLMSILSTLLLGFLGWAGLKLDTFSGVISALQVSNEELTYQIRLFQSRDYITRQALSQELKLRDQILDNLDGRINSLERRQP